MSDVTDRNDPKRSTIADFATDEIGLLIALPIIVCWLAVAVTSAVFYPVAFLLGFEPRRWWVDADNFHWSHFLRNLAVTVSLVALAWSGAIVFLTTYHH